MARLTNVFRTEDTNYTVGRRQIPVVANDSLMMLMDLNSKGLCIDSPTIRGKEFEEFTRKYNLLSEQELRESLEIDSATFLSILNQCVQCVGCRRRVERLFNQLALSGHATLDPLVLKNTRVLTINEDRMKTPQALGTILYRHHDVLNNLLDSKLRNKTRCLLHSLDAFRSKPFSETWREVWSSMKHNCRNELAVIETKELQEVLENYLKKHKFCQGCRTKIEKAYKILVGESTAKEKGFVAALYANFEKCHRDKHIHVYTNKVDFLDALIRRAEPEVNGSYSKLRERHAKTLEIAQEEVLTCVGMIMYERLRRIYINLREEERACQVLAAVGVHALCRSFDTSVEKKQGISNLELLYQEISRAEKAKEHRREQKKLKKKKKKIEKKNGFRMCDATMTMNQTSVAMNGEDSEEGSEEGNREPDYDEEEEHDDEAEDEAVDVSEECGNQEPTINNGRNAKNIKNENICKDHAYQKAVASLESNSDVTEEDDDEEEIEIMDQHYDHEKHVEIVDAETVPCQAVNSKKKKRSKQKKSKINNNKTSNNGCNGKTNNNTKVPSKCQTSADILVLPSSASRAPNCARANLSVEVNKCSDCLAPTLNCPCDVKDSGYGSEPNFSHENSRVGSELSSPEGSEISCSDGFCNHDHEHDRERTHSGDRSNNGLNIGIIEIDGKHKLMAQGCENENCDSMLCQQRCMTLFSLQQMLENVDCCAGEDDAENYIPQEVVLKFQCQREQVEQKRRKLRENLRQNFAKLCNKLAAGIENTGVVDSAAKYSCGPVDCK